MRRVLTVARRAIVAFGLLFMLAIAVAAVSAIGGMGRSAEAYWNHHRSSDG